MSEYWVSKKKYFCKYCDIYIADDAPSRQQHENGLRHKGNVDRFIRGLYKAGEKRKKDQEEEKRELARVEQAAQAAYSQDVAAGRARPGTAGLVASTSAAPKKPIPKPSNPYANYSTAASLGLSDPDAEKIAAETERRRTQGVAGEWEVVGTITPVLAAFPDNEDEKSEIKTNTGDAITGVKREAEAPADDEDTRTYKLRKKSWGSGLSGGYDPDAIPIKLKKREEVQVDPAASTAAPASTSTLPQETTVTSTGAPKWTNVQWKKAGELAHEPSAPVTPSEEVVPVKAELQATALPITNKTDPLASPIPSNEEAKHTLLKAEEPLLTPEPSSSSSGMFRKRKAPAGGSRGRRS